MKKLSFSDKKATDEVVSLLERVTEGATSEKTSITEVLRLCLRLAVHLQNEELKTWAQTELNGYPSKKDLPDYRVLGSQVKGNFAGWGGREMRNAGIPQMVIDEDDRDWLFTNYMTEPVATLEELSKGDKSEPLRAPWPTDIVAFYQRKEIYEGFTLVEAWRLVSKAAVSGIIDTVRTRILEFALSIGQEIDFKKKPGATVDEIVKPSPEKVTQIVHNTIYGGANVAVGNSGSTVQNNIQVIPGDFESLKQYLKGIGLTDSLIDDLDAALEKDQSNAEQPGPATSGWLARTMIMIGKGSLSVGSNTAGSLISTALMQFLGLS